MLFALGSPVYCAIPLSSKAIILGRQHVRRFRVSAKLEVLRKRLEPLVADVLKRHGASGLVPVDAVVDAVVYGLLSRPKRKFLSARAQIIEDTNGAPRCWTRNLSIPMDAPNDSYAGFSIDHVIGKDRGGRWLGRGNLRPAHRLCNSVRSNPQKPNGRRKYEAFLNALAALQGEPCANMLNMA